ncbi:MAG: carbon-nitrogen family hydrolase [Bacillota bacterium]
MRVSAVQMDVITGNTAANLEAALRGIEEAAGSGAEVITLPELWTAGYVWLAGSDYTGPREAEQTAEAAAREEVLSVLGGVARDEGVWLVAGSLPEITDRGIRNTAFVIDPGGEIIHRYSKVHLIHLMGEPANLIAGDDCGTFSLGQWRAGVMICYDLRFPELARKLALDGAGVIFIPAQWPAPRIDHWIALVQARAIENQCYVVACNRVGVGGADRFPGHSMIVDPSGQVLARGGEGPCVLTATMDADAVRRTREFLPCLGDRRPDVYGR